MKDSTGVSVRLATGDRMEFPDATDWAVGGNGDLDVLDVEATLAMFPPGQWHAVWFGLTAEAAQNDEPDKSNGGIDAHERAIIHAVYLRPEVEQALQALSGLTLTMPEYEALNRTIWARTP